MLVKIARGVARYCENKTVIPELREEDFFQNCSISAKKPIVATADESLGSSACFWSPPIFDFIQTPRNEMVRPQAVSALRVGELHFVLIPPPTPNRNWLFARVV